MLAHRCKLAGRLLAPLGRLLSAARLGGVGLGMSSAEALLGSSAWLSGACLVGSVGRAAILEEPAGGGTEGLFALLAGAREGRGCGALLG